jgi:hypothetical protein
MIEIIKTQLLRGFGGTQDRFDLIITLDEIDNSI